LDQSEKERAVKLLTRIYGRLVSSGYEDDVAAVPSLRNSDDCQCDMLVGSTDVPSGMTLFEAAESNLSQQSVTLQRKESGPRP